MDFFNWNFWMIGRYSPMRTGLGKIPSLGQFHLLGQSHYVNDGHKNGMNTRLLGILLHIILHISTFNHSS